MSNQVFFGNKKTLVITKDKTTFTLKVSQKELKKIMIWLPDRQLMEILKKEFRSVGMIFIGLGLLHFLLSGVLDPTWGILLCFLGCLNLIIHHYAMHVVNGLALIFVGIMNIITGFTFGVGFWAIFGIFQIYWGYQWASEVKLYIETSEASDLHKQILPQQRPGQDVYYN